MQVDIEVTGESWDLLVRPLRAESPVHRARSGAARNKIAAVSVYSFSRDLPQAEELLEMARNHCPPAVKDIKHVIDAAKRR